MKKRRMSALQRKYFGKHHKRVSALRVKRKVRYVTMARRGRRRGGFRRASGRVGGFKSMLAPIISGVADSFLDAKLPVQGVGATAVGMFMHNGTMRDIGLYKIGGSITSIIPIPGLSGGGSSGGFI